MKTVFVGSLVLLLWVMGVQGQNNPCVAASSTNCTIASGSGLVLSEYPSQWPYVCTGEVVSLTAAPTVGLGGLIEIISTNEDCEITTEITPLTSESIVSNGWYATGVFEGTGTGSNAIFTPTGCGPGSVVFNLTYNEPCGGTDTTVSITNSYTVIAVASLAPTNCATCELVSSSSTLQTYAVPVSTNPSVTNLEIIATSCPSIPVVDLPDCWSLNGVWTNATYISLTAPGVYSVVCMAGTSAMTNVIWVTQNGDVEENCSSAGSILMGYWTFDDSIVDWWPANGNAYDAVGTNTGTINGGVTYTPDFSGDAFNFDGETGYVTFGTNAGNFGTNNFTIDFWIETQAANQESVLGKRPVCGAGSMWDVRTQPGGDNIVFEISQDSAGTDYADFSSHARINDGQFHEVTINRFGLTLTMYIDGNFDNSITTSGIANVQNNTELTAGKSACTGVDGTTLLYGMLDEIKLANGTAGPWVGNRNQQPVADYGLQNPVSPWIDALKVDTNTSANLSYRYVEDNGQRNINCLNGAVRFWFNPDWNGGQATNTGVWLEMGDTNSTEGWWALWADSTGSSLCFETQSNGVSTKYFTNAIATWTSNTWYEVVLDYSSTNTSLYINGALAQNGPGLISYPNIPIRLANGFSIGSDHTGNNQCRGLIDEFATFNCPLSAEEVADDYLAEVAAAGTGLDDYFGWSYGGSPAAITIDNPANGSVIY